MENTNITLKEHRVRTIGEILGKLQNNGRVCCVRYTGYGKTYYIMKEIINILSNKKFLILVPTDDLLQTYKQTFINTNTIIKTYQSFLNKKDSELYKYRYIDYIIADECHRLGDNKWSLAIENLIKCIHNVKVIGFTATPLRGDSVDISQTFFKGCVTEEFNLIDGINAGYLPKIKYVIGYCSLSKDREELKEKMLDVDRYYINNLMNVSKIFKDNIDKHKLNDNLKIVLFVPKVKDIFTAKESCVKWFSDAFPYKKINTYNVSSYNTTQFNRNQLKRYSNNEDKNSIDIMISVDKLKEGLHLPACSIAILLRKTVSPVVYFQQIGRAINGSTPIVFDLIDNEKHLYYIDKDANNGIQRSNVDREKEMFDNCIDLIYTTTEIDSIFEKYETIYKRRVRKIPPEMEKQIISENDLTYKEIADKYGLSVSVIANIFKRTGNSRTAQVYTTEEADNIILNNLQYIKENMGNVPRYKIAEELGMSEATLKKGLERNNIQYTRMYEGFKYNESTANKFKEMINKGVSAKNIQKELNLSSYFYKKYCKHFGVRLKRAKASSDDKNFILCNYSNLSLNELSRRTGLGVSIIKNVLEDNNINTKYRNAAEPVTPEEELNICKIYEKVGSLYKTSKETGRHKGTIKKIVLKHGYTIQKGTR